MKKIVSVLLLFALLLALCACGAAEEVNLPLPGGLRFGMSPEEVADLLGKKLGDTEHGEAYTPEYRMRPEGFDSDHRLSPLGTNLLAEYSAGKRQRRHKIRLVQHGDLLYRASRRAGNELSGPRVGLSQHRLEKRQAEPFAAPGQRGRRAELYP